MLSAEGRVSGAGEWPRRTASHQKPCAHFQEDELLLGGGQTRRPADLSLLPVLEP